MRMILYGIPAVLLFGPLAQAGEACDVPAEFVHRTTVVEGNLVVTLALDQSTYLRGQPVRSYLGVENTGSDTVRVCAGSDPLNIFAVMADSCVSLTDECILASAYFYPQVIYYFGECITILPGECEVRLVTWDGWSWIWDEEQNDWIRGLPAPGTYIALAGIYLPTSAGRNFVIPNEGIALPVTIAETSAVDVQNISWGSLKYFFGH